MYFRKMVAVQWAILNDIPGWLETSSILMQDFVKVLMPLQNTAKRLCVGVTH